MEASALQAPAATALPAPAALPQPRVAMGMPLLRFRSDEQLVALFRAGHDDAFRAIHDRYHKRLFAYARQMLPGRQDAEDALQDVFVRAYSGLRTSDHELALRAWLFRVAHNRCIDELRRPVPPPPEVLQLVRTTFHDPLVEIDLRESLRRLVEDIRRLPEQQRSALLMRELVGMTYADLSVSLGISVGAVKSLLVRARVALAQAAEARDTSCVLIREQLADAHDRGLRPNANARKHIRDCVGCKSFRRELRGVSRQLAAVSPAVGPLSILAKLGFSGGAGGGGGVALLGGGGGAATAGGVAVGVNHLATLLVAAVATAGGAVELQHTIIAPPHHATHARVAVRHRRHVPPLVSAPAQSTSIQAIAAVQAAARTVPALTAPIAPTTIPTKPRLHHKRTAGGAGLSPSTGASALTNSSTTDDSTTATGTSALGACATTPPASTSTATGASSTSSTGTATTTATTPTTAPASSPTTAPTQSGTSTTPTTACPTTAPSTSSAATPTAGSTSTSSSSSPSSTSSTSSGSTTSGSTSGSSTGSTSTSSGSTSGSTSVSK